MPASKHLAARSIFDSRLVIIDGQKSQNRRSKNVLNWRTKLSHELRTPLTSIVMHAQILSGK
jgi:hypothetical protein